MYVCVSVAYSYFYVYEKTQQKHICKNKSGEIENVNKCVGKCLHKASVLQKQRNKTIQAPHCRLAVGSWQVSSACDLRREVWATPASSLHSQSVVVVVSALLDSLYLHTRKIHFFHCFDGFFLTTLCHTLPL